MIDGFFLPGSFKMLKTRKGDCVRQPDGTFKVTYRFSVGTEAQPMGKYISEDCESLDDCPSPSRDMTGRLPGDATLRLHGFHVYARPRHGPDVWMRAGQFFTEEQAHQQVFAESQ